MSIANFTVVSLLSMVSCLVSCSTGGSASANVTGTVVGLDQRVTPYEGLKSMTEWAAEQYGEQDSKGTLV